MQTKTSKTWHPLDLFGLAFLVAVTVGVNPLMRVFQPSDFGAILVYACFGTIGAAAALLAIFPVLGPRSFRFRIAMTATIGLLLFAAWFLGLALITRGGTRFLRSDELAMTGAAFLSLPLFAFASQAPLWLVRLLFRWQITLVPVWPEGSRPTASMHAELAPSLDVEPGRPGPLTLRDMFVAMGIIGVTLGLARFGQQGSELYLHMSVNEYWMGLGIGLASCLGISLVTTLPILVATLAWRTPLLAILGIGIYVAGVLTFGITITKFLMGRSGMWEIICISTVILSFTTVVVVPLLIARRRGFRLHWRTGSPGPSAPKPDDESAPGDDRILDTRFT